MLAQCLGLDSHPSTTFFCGSLPGRHICTFALPTISGPLRTLARTSTILGCMRKVLVTGHVAAMRVRCIRKSRIPRERPCCSVPPGSTGARLGASGIYQVQYFLACSGQFGWRLREPGLHQNDAPRVALARGANQGVFRPCKHLAIPATNFPHYPFRA